MGDDLREAATAVVAWWRDGRSPLVEREVFARLEAALHAGGDTAAAGLPAWARAARDADPALLARVVTRIVDAIAYPPIDKGPGRRGAWASKGDAAAVLALWRGLGAYDLEAFAGDVEIVALAARNSAHPLFARDIRGEGWTPRAADRSRSVATLLRQDRWSERLRAAVRWRDHVGPEWVERRALAVASSAVPVTPAPVDDAELLRKFGGGR